MHFLSCRHQHNLLRRKENCDDTNSISIEFNLFSSQSQLLCVFIYPRAELYPISEPVLVPVPKYQYQYPCLGYKSIPPTLVLILVPVPVLRNWLWYPYDILVPMLNPYSDLVPKPILEYLYPYSDTCIHTRVPNLVLVRSTVPSFGLNYCSQIPKMGTVRV